MRTIVTKPIRVYLREDVLEQLDQERRPNQTLTQQINALLRRALNESKQN